MATSSSNMKGFYRQKKNKSGIRKPTSTNKSSLIHAATLGSDITQPTALVTHDSPDLKGFCFLYPLLFFFFFFFYL